jgi:diazepam-binding inhibitor (GABA receptor modulator, acyl-CoA-binding protein)
MQEIKERFESAVEQSKQISMRPSNDTLLQLYGLYKQSVVGDVNTEPPTAFDFVNKAKYEAWSSFKGTSQEDAMKAYIELIGKLKN